MKKIWFDEAWEDYIYWQTQDKKTLKRINSLTDFSSYSCRMADKSVSYDSCNRYVIVLFVDISKVRKSDKFKSGGIACQLHILFL